MITNSLYDNFSSKQASMDTNNPTDLLINNSPNSNYSELESFKGQSFILDSMLSYTKLWAQIESIKSFYIGGFI